MQYGGVESRDCSIINFEEFQRLKVDEQKKLTHVRGMSEVQLTDI